MNNKYSNLPSPCYIISEEALHDNLKRIKNVAEAAGVTIIPALKANAFWQLFPEINAFGFQAASASSLHEARLIYEEMGVKAHTYSPVFKQNEFPEILQYSSHIIFNSINQFNSLYPEVCKHENEISVGLRINPEFSQVSTDIYNACTPGSRLGISANDLPEKLPEGIDGLHFHALCESGAQALESVLLVLEQKFAQQLKQIKWINMGGGHLMTRNDYDVEHLIGILKDFKKKHNLKIILEPGSAFTWQTGVLKSTVLDIVNSGNVRTAMLDVSFTAHMPDCLEMPYKPAILGAKEPDATNPGYRMGGNSCLSGDFMGNWAFDHKLKVGDTIVFDDMIHYTMVKTTTFNGVPHPGIGIIRQNGKFDLLRKFGYEDYKNRMG